MARVQELAGNKKVGIEDTPTPLVEGGQALRRFLQETSFANFGDGYRIESEIIGIGVEEVPEIASGHDLEDPFGLLSGGWAGLFATVTASSPRNGILEITIDDAEHSAMVVHRGRLVRPDLPLQEDFLQDWQEMKVRVEIVERSKGGINGR